MYISGNFKCAEQFNDNNETINKHKSVSIHNEITSSKFDGFYRAVRNNKQSKQQSASLKYLHFKIVFPVW